VPDSTVLGRRVGHFTDRHQQEPTASEATMTDKSAPRELKLEELDRVNGGSIVSDFIDVVKTVISILNGGGPAGKGLR
jgi:hypothetical protein